MDWNEIFKNENKGSGDDPVIKLPEIKMPFNIPPVPVIVGIALLFWLSTGIYIIKPNQQGIVLRFGKYIMTTDPGVHWKMPRPIDVVYTPNVTTVRREEIGFRIIDKGPPARYRDVPLESLMLTGDQNIIDIDIVIQYRVIDSTAYMFNVRDRSKAVRDAAEAAIREVVGRADIDKVLTTEKFTIQQDTKTLVQQILDRYQLGYIVDAVQLQDVHPPKEVIASFKDVASAREDKNRKINEAEGYRNAILPEARGKVAQIINAAEAYRQEKINKAIGEAESFKKVLSEYSKSKAITKKRLHIETIEEVFRKMEKIIVDKQGHTPLLPIFSLNGNKNK